jgi:hypothetical protein
VYKLPAPVTTAEPGDFPKISYPDQQDASFHDSHGGVIGTNPQPKIGQAAPANGTTLLKVKSATATATSVRVTEIY